MAESKLRVIVETQDRQLSQLQGKLKKTDRAVEELNGANKKLARSFRGVGNASKGAANGIRSTGRAAKSATEGVKGLNAVKIAGGCNNNGIDLPVCKQVMVIRVKLYAMFLCVILAVLRAAAYRDKFSMVNVLPDVFSKPEPLPADTYNSKTDGSHMEYICILSLMNTALMTSSYSFILQVYLAQYSGSCDRYIS